MIKDDRSITEALGLTDEWEVTTRGKIQKMYSKNDMIHETGLAIIGYLQGECLGEDNLVASEYEKKLIMAGFLLASIRNEAMLKGMAVKMMLEKIISSKDLEL